MYKLLQGVRILDLTRLLPGGYATQLLGDMGAEVLKIEDPWQGDYQRWSEPHFEGTQESVTFWGLNRNKKSMILNLKTERDKQVFLKLLQSYDIVLEGFRPGVMDSLGLGYEKLKEVNPGVIMCSISGYGQDGPFKLRAGHDLNYTAIAGSLGLGGAAGGAPAMSAVQIADVGGGALMSVVGILTAFISRQKTGSGQYIDISMMDSVVSWMTMLFMQLEANAPDLKRGETRLGGGEICYNVYKTQDEKYMSLGALEPKFWKTFCEIVGRPELVPQQFSRNPEIKAEVEEIFKTRTRGEWVEIFADKDVCCEPVLDINEVKDHPQVAHRRLFTTLIHPEVGEVNVIRNPISFTYESSVEDQLPPEYGEHTGEILEALGLTDER